MFEAWYSLMNHPKFAFLCCQKNNVNKEKLVQETMIGYKFVIFDKAHLFVQLM